VKRGLALATIAAWIGAASTPAAADRAIGLGGTPPLVWHLDSQSPRAVSPPSDDLYTSCGKADASLVQAAARNAAHQLRGEGPFASDELAFNLRAAGGPQVWPRAWSIQGAALDDADVAHRFDAWLASTHALGERRCGVARLTRADGTRVVSAITVDALADLEPLPATARVGEWITLKARVLVPATDAKVVLLGPRGLPRTVLASLSGDDIRATFSVDQPGPWLVQVLASVSTGPRPVLEAYIHAGSSPPLAFAESPAPGEDAASSSKVDVDAMRAMLNAARVSEGLKPLSADAALDKLAAEHSAKMLQAKTVGHDVGDGDPSTRLSAANVRYRSIGENVAGASSLTRAHRALWASPSHRGNILETRLARVGIGVARGPDGRVWVTELFLDGASGAATNGGGTLGF
jgi:uncharacterized protein YkwD